MQGLKCESFAVNACEFLYFHFVMHNFENELGLKNILAFVPLFT